jgi:hypothetical protein
MQFESQPAQITRTISELVEQLRQAAYDEGYADALSASRPLDGAAHQFGEQRQVGEGADRVSLGGGA